MRDSLLYSYYSEISSLKGVGSRLKDVISKHIGPLWLDLIFFKPSGVKTWKLSQLSELSEGQNVCLRLHLTKVPAIRSKIPLKFTLTDSKVDLEVVYFHQIFGLTSKYSIDSEMWVCGRVESFRGHYQMTHPDYFTPVQGTTNPILREIQYPACKGLSSKQIARLIDQVLIGISELPEWLDSALLNKLSLLSFGDSLQKFHDPETTEDLDVNANARRRLALDELLAEQIALRSIRNRRFNDKAPIISNMAVVDDVISKLPFTLTPSQCVALSRVQADLVSGYRMNRLIQGDVGAGKTVIALLAMIAVVKSGFQAVLMAPTEILARQHYLNYKVLLEELGIQSTFLSGQDKGKMRQNKRNCLHDGTLHMVFGTHAVFQDGVEFQNLGLAVIDEQHRFGVAQRERLFEKGRNIHCLTMSATPIPRSLALIQFGDCDLTTITDKPKGRPEIQTAVMPRDRIAPLLDRLKKAIDRGEQVYWICPLVSETEALDYIAAEVRFKHLQSEFGERVGLVNGQLSSDAKDKVLSEFRDGQIKILCATTVVEVGIDVKNATIIVIEQAERFGLAQLHQLRGRVGRGDKASACILLYDSPLSVTAKSRLQTLRDTQDGFEIAEMDWKLRGEGDITGARQTGIPDYHFADPHRHSDLIAIAAKEAQLLLDHKDKIPNERKHALNLLLQLFRKPVVF